VTIGLRKEVSRLQNVSSDTEKTSKGGSGHADDLVSVVCSDWGGRGGRWDVYKLLAVFLYIRTVILTSGTDGCGSIGDGGVGVDWRTCWVTKKRISR